MFLPRIATSETLVASSLSVSFSSSSCYWFGSFNLSFSLSFSPRMWLRRDCRASAPLQSFLLSAPGVGGLVTGMWWRT